MGNQSTILKKPIVMSEKEWNNVIEAHGEIVKVLERYNVPDGFACKILIDIERQIDKGMMRTVMAAKGVI